MGCFFLAVCLSGAWAEDHTAELLKAFANLYSSAPPQSAEVLADRGVSWLNEQTRQHKYQTIPHLILDFEASTLGVTPNYQLLDTLIDEVRAKVPKKAQYTREEAVAALQVVADVLLQHNFIYIRRGQAFYESLEPQMLDDEAREYIRHWNPRTTTERFFSTSDTAGSLRPGSQERTRHYLAHLDEEFHFAQCDTFSLLYLAVGNALGWPLRMAGIHQHRFTRWCFDDRTYLNWNTTERGTITDEEMVSIVRSAPAVAEGLKTIDTFDVADVLSDACMNAARSKGDLLDIAIQLSPRRAQLYSMRAGVLAGKGNTTRALADASEAVELEPQNAWYRRVRAEIYYDSGSYREALEDADAAVTLAKTEGGYGYSAWWNYCIRAEIREALGDREGADADLAKALEASNRVSDVYLTRIQILLGRGQIDDALSECDRLVAEQDNPLVLAPQKAMNYGCRAECYREAGKYREALADCEKAITLAPEIAQFYVLRGRCQAVAGKYAEALQDFDKAVALCPGDGRLYMWRGLGEGLAEEFEKALEDINKAIQLAGERGDALALAYSARAHIAYSNRRLEVALGDVNAAMENAGPWPVVQVMLFSLRANIYYSMSYLDEAVADIDAAIELNPTRAESYALRAGFRLQQKLPEQALADANRAIELSAQMPDPDYLLQRARIWKALEDFAKAIEDCEAALALNAQSAEALYEQGEALEFLGEYGKACTAYKRALALNPRMREAADGLERAQLLQ